MIWLGSFIVADFFTGTCSAIHTSTWSSKRNFIGIAKKVLMLRIVALAHEPDVVFAPLIGILIFQSVTICAYAADMWESALDRVIPFFAFSLGIRKLIYTTNAIESLNRTIRKAIKTKGCFSTDEAAKKLVWLSLREVLQKWKRPTRTWSVAMEEMAILYGSRFTDYLE